MKIFNKLNTRHLRGDLFGGLTAGIVALPLALAFGVQSGMGPVAGLYGAIALGILASLFGGTATQISGPTGPMTVVSTMVVVTAIDHYGTIESGFGFIIAVFILSGLFQIVFGFLKLGTYIEYIPYPVVSGFMTGIGVIIILLQVFPFLGQVSPKTVVDVVFKFNTALSNINWTSVVIATSTIAIIYLFPRITKLVPSTLVALIVVTLAAYLTQADVPLLGDIPKGIPKPRLDTLGGLDWITMDYRLLVELALTLALLGAIDSLLTSVIADNVTKTKHDSNKELVGQGIGNMAAGVIGGLPGAGATMRTLVNVNSGGKTAVSGILHGAVLLVILFGVGAMVEVIPKAVLSGILITVGIGIIDYRGLRHITHVPRADMMVMFLVLFMTVFIDLIAAVTAGLILSSVLFMKKMSDDTTRELKIGPLRDFLEKTAWQDKEVPPDIIDKIYVKQLDGPFFFGFAAAFQRAAKAIPEIRLVIFRMGEVPYMDQSGLYALEEVVQQLEDKGIVVVLSGVQKQPMRMLKRINLVPALIPEKFLFKKFADCIHFFNTTLELTGGVPERFFEEIREQEKSVQVPQYRL